MAASRAQFNTLFSQLADLDTQKAELTGRMKEAIELFTAEHAESGSEKPYKKAVKKGYRNYKEIQKDRTEFILVESDTDTITEALLNEEVATTPQGDTE